MGKPANLLQVFGVVAGRVHLLIEVFLHSGLGAGLAYVKFEVVLVMVIATVERCRMRPKRNLDYGIHSVARKDRELGLTPNHVRRYQLLGDHDHLPGRLPRLIVVPSRTEDLSIS